MQFLQGLLGGGNMSLMGLVVFVLVTYFSGTYVPFMAKYRNIIIIAGAVLFFIVLIIQKMIAKKSAAAIEDKLRSQAQEQLDTARPDRKPQVQALQKQLTEAIAALKTSKMGTGALYALPWYIIIGPPGSGKSTALQESGLNFPYMSQGRKGIRGVGGTRNCDWWFTDQGILLDTAGRYTTELEDRDEWLSFLDMLKKFRKRKPINGAIVCVSVVDLVQCSEEEREGHVKNIKDRIDELTKRLEQVFPVYLLFTKCDLLNGFVDFFEDFGKSDRSQVWGFTLPYGGAKVESYQPVFDEEIRKLYAQLSAQRILALSTERPADKKRRIFGFPIQFSLAHKKLADFVSELFRPNPFQESSTLRGIYFTSGTQEGTPIDQLVAAMGGAFGLQEDAAGLLSQAVDKKSYFITNLFSKIIFGDQNLARSSTKVARRRRLLRTGLALGSVAVLIIFTISLGIAFVGNLHLMRSVGGTARKLQDAGKSSPQDLAGNLQALEDLRVRIGELDGYTREDLPMSLRWGLYRGKDVYLGEDGKSGIRKVYINAINTMFLRPLGEVLAKEMTALRENRNKGAKEFDQLFDLLQVYQMLGGKIPAKRELVDSVLKDQDRWLKTLGPTAPNLPEESKKIAAAQRDFYVDQVVKGMEWKEIALPTIEVDPKLIADVIEDLKGGLWMTQSFRNLINQTPQIYKPVTVEALLSRVPGKDLFECPEEHHVPGAYTQLAYSEYVRSAIKETSQNLSDKLKLINVEKPADAIAADLRDKYTTEYAVRWQTFFKNINLKKFDHLRDAADKLKVLTAQNSPFKDLFKGVWEGRALQLSERPDDVINKSADDRKWLDEALKALEELQRGLNKMLNLTTPGDRFVSMEAKELKEQSFLLDNCKGKIESATKMADLALAESAARVLNRSLQSTLEAFVTEAQGEAENLWKKTVVDVHVKKLAGKFPMTGEAMEEVPMRTFSEVFNPKTGSFWKTVTQLNRLRDGFKFEDRSLVQFSSDYDECVKKAEQFRELYSKDAEQMEQIITVTLQPRGGVVEVTFYIGDKKFSSLDDPDRRGTIIWSEASPKGAKLDIRHDDGQRTATEKHAGQDWGLLRLAAEGEIKPGKNDKSFECTWTFNVTVSGTPVKRLADATFELPKKENPFAPKFFTDYKCPEKLGP